MSGYGGIVTELPAQPGAGPVQPGPDGGRADAEHRGHVTRLQTFPDSQGQHLTVQFTEPAERRLDGQPLTYLGRRVAGRRGEPLPQPLAEPFPADATAMVVGEHPPGHAVEPEPHLIARRHLGASAPGDQERLGDHVGRVLTLRDPA